VGCGLWLWAFSFSFSSLFFGGGGLYAVRSKGAHTSAASTPSL
jgi:hypothetical protein